MWGKRLKQIPNIAKAYLLLGSFFIVLPFLLGLYEGHTGKFLVTIGESRGSPFYNTVIYIQRHDFWGAYGVIINKPVESREFRRPFPELGWKVNLFDGGPVGYGQYHFLLLKNQESSPNGLWLMRTDTLRKEEPEIADMYDRQENVDAGRLYTGYAGWGIWQLNREIVRGTWAVLDYDPALMFSTDVEAIWYEAIKRVQAEAGE